MTREEAISLLGENATNEQITALLDKFHEKDAELRNKTNELAAITNDLSKSKTDLAAAQKQLDDIEKQNMSEQEKLEADRKEAAANVAESRKILAKAKATEILSTIGITDEELINSIVSDDVEATQAKANVYVKTLTEMKENTIRETTEKFATADLKPTASNPNSEGMTWEKFSKLTLEEQNKFEQEHPEEFANL